MFVQSLWELHALFSEGIYKPLITHSNDIPRAESAGFAIIGCTTMHYSAGVQMKHLCKFSGKAVCEVVEGLSHTSEVKMIVYMLSCMHVNRRCFCGQHSSGI